MTLLGVSSVKREKMELNIKTGLTERDYEIFDIMNEWNGLTYNEVLLNTVFFGRTYNTMKTRLQKLRQRGIIKYKLTGLIKPKYAIIYTPSTREAFNKLFGISLNGSPNPAPTTINHLITEQIAYFWLKKAGKDIERTIVSRWRGAHKHTPDLVYYNKKNQPVYVEIETNPKRKERYIDIFARMQSDNVGAVLYVFENEKKMKSLGKKIPVWDEIRYTTIDMLKDGVLNERKIKAIKQIDYLKSIGMIIKGV
jgi:hypothetical protein